MINQSGFPFLFKGKAYQAQVCSLRHHRQTHKCVSETARVRGVMQLEPNLCQLQ